MPEHSHGATRQTLLEWLALPFYAVACACLWMGEKIDGGL